MDKVEDQNDKMNNMNSRIKQLEKELVDSKEKLGEAMNTVNDLETKNIQLTNQLMNLS